MPRLLAVVAMAAIAMPSLSAWAGVPLPDPNFAHPVLSSKCTAEDGNPYEATQYRQEGWKGAGFERYPGLCQRMHFTYGPISIRPGQNDVILSPVTIEKPAYDGYITRFRPNLVRADGTIPPIEEVHLHHAVWYSAVGGPQNFNNYGNSAFAAAGEEKTIFDIPRGYGFPIYGSDQWQILYMIHNQRAAPDTVWITYDVDFIAKADAEQALHLKPAYPLWLDVRPSVYPVFNAQRGFGHRDPRTGRYICTFPMEQTASFDPFGASISGQGQAGNGKGTPYTMPARGSPFGRITSFTGGTVIGAGGHLHPGGVSVNLDVQRGQQTKRVFTSEAHYWDWKNPAKEGGPPTSWDLSMSVTGLPKWGIHVNPGDTLWMNATYDVTDQSTYEDMGIIVSWLVPDGPAGTQAPGLDPMKAAVDSSEGCTSGGLLAKVPTICDRGVVTHGHMAEAAHKGGPNGTLQPRIGSRAARVYMTGFSYQPEDANGLPLGTGVPTVPLGGSLTFDNVDASADVYHSVTSCAYPCDGPTGIAYPLADGASSRGSQVDFDSGQLGYGILGAAKNQYEWTLPVSAQAGFKAGQIYSYFCRVHPGMRGSFGVEGPGLQPAPPPPPPKPKPAPPAPGGEWRSYSHDLSNSRSQPEENKIGLAEAATLAPQWTFSSQAAGGAGDFTGTPIVADGYLFAASNRGWVFALNPDTGQLIWQKQLPRGSVNSTVAVGGGRVYVAVSDPDTADNPVPAGHGPYEVALDEKTGDIKWQRQLDSQPGADAYASPVFFDGLVLQGVSGEAAELGANSDRFAFHGSMDFIDAASGSLIKKTWTIPPSDWSKGYAGATIWSTAAIDPGTRTAYVGSGNPFQPEHEHPNTDAILRFDLNRAHRTFGEITGVYHGQVDTYAQAASALPCVVPPGGGPSGYIPKGAGSCGQIDLDFGASPNLWRQGGKLVVGDGQKSGYYHAADASTMKGIWQTLVAPPYPTFGGVIGTAAFDGHSLYGPDTIPGYAWSLDAASGSRRWVTPMGDGLHEAAPPTVANGVVYMVDTRGFLDGYDASTGAPVLQRPLTLGSGTGSNPPPSWGGVAVARHTVYVETGVTGLANGFIIAFRPGGATGIVGGGGGGGGGGGSAAGAGSTVVAGPGAFATTYATPEMVLAAGQPLYFVNNDLPQHNVVATDMSGGAPLFQSRLVGIGEQATVDGAEKLKAGSYNFYCTIHPGMRGTLLVQ